MITPHHIYSRLRALHPRLTARWEISMQKAFNYMFPNEQTAKVLNVPDGLDYADSLAALELKGPVPSMVIIGGASKMSPESKIRVSQLFSQVLAPIAESYGITVLDGGTDAGVIQMMGQARHHISGSFNLVGVAPKAKVSLPGHTINSDDDNENRDLIHLEENHTHFALIPGVHWGKESPWLANFALLLARSYPSITILINGGTISLSDLMENLSVGRQAIVIAGSGRLADDIANTISGSAPSEDSAIRNLVKTYYPSKLSVFELTDSLDVLTKQLKSHFNPDVI